MLDDIFKEVLEDSETREILLKKVKNLIMDLKFNPKFIGEIIMLNDLINTALEDERVQQGLVDKIKKVINDISFTQEEKRRIKTAIVETTISLVKNKLENKLDDEDYIPGN